MNGAAGLPNILQWKSLSLETIFLNRSLAAEHVFAPVSQVGSDMFSANLCAGNGNDFSTNQHLNRTSGSDI